MLNFKEKIRDHRPFDKEPHLSQGEIPSLSTFESDRGRILNSAAIRRLQQKTQVFPLERNAAVRSRLTHSLEVQQVGRYISQLIFEQLSVDQKQTYGLIDLERQFESLVEMSCLMHDVGNPPFGHFGERAISDWFAQHLVGLFEDAAQATLAQPLYSDLAHFEGNAQAIRLVHTLLGLNLTYSQVSGIVKYTRRGDHNKPAAEHPHSYSMKKVGYYLSENAYMCSLRRSLSIAEYCRSPLVYIMEAADDISYGIADIEDAVEKGIFSRQQLEVILAEEFSVVAQAFALDDTKLMQRIVQQVVTQWRKLNVVDDSYFFILLRTELHRRLARYASQQFIQHIEPVFYGSFNRALLEDHSLEHALVQTLKNTALKYAFCDPDVEQRELQGYRIINGLLDLYAPLLRLNHQAFRLLDETRQSTLLYHQRLYNKLPKKYVAAYQKAVAQLDENSTTNLILDGLPSASFKEWEFYFRVRLIQDYLSGMTDQYAFDEFRALNVID